MIYLLVTGSIHCSFNDVFHQHEHCGLQSDECK